MNLRYGAGAMRDGGRPRPDSCSTPSLAHGVLQSVQLVPLHSGEHGRGCLVNPHLGRQTGLCPLRVARAERHRLNVSHF